MARIDTNAVIFGVKFTDQSYDPLTFPSYGTRLLYTKLNNDGTSSLFVMDYLGNVYGPFGVEDLETGQNLDWIQFKDQVAQPPNPATGFKRVYTKSDGLYIVNSSGVETGPLGTGGGGGSADLMKISGAAWTSLHNVRVGDWYATEFTDRSWERPVGSTFSDQELQTYGSGGWGTTYGPPEFSSGDRSLLIPKTGLYLLSAYGTFQADILGDFRKMAIVDANIIEGQNDPGFASSKGMIPGLGITQWLTADSKAPIQTGVTELNCSVATLILAGTEIALIAKHDGPLNLDFSGYLSYIFLSEIPDDIAGDFALMSNNSSSSHVLGFHSDLAGSGGGG